MSWFPQIGGGSVTQFPFTRSRTWRAIRNELESGERLMLPDAAAGSVNWNLSYQDLTDDEAGRLQALFTASQGAFGSFSFADPLANLLAWSEDLARPDWQETLLSASGGATDPQGTLNAWTLTNSSPGDLQLTQTVALPGDYVTCFSAWLRAASVFQVALRRDSLVTTAVIGPVWKRFSVSGAIPGDSQNAAYSIEVPAGKAIHVWGLQVEAQPYASQYKSTTAGAGIYEETYFGSDELTVTDTARGLHSCAFTLISRI